MADATLNGVNGAHVSAGGEGPRPPPSAEEVRIPTLSRTRALPNEVEEADITLSLGEFQNEPTLSHSEVKYLLDTILAQRRAEAGGQKIGQTETLAKTMDYLSVFARFKTRENILAVERVIQGYEGRFESFERSQLATLCPTDGDEAFTLIPSLKAKFSMAEMDDITRQISDLKTFE